MTTDAMNTARLDLTDPALQEALIKVRSDASPETACVFGYEGKSKIVVKSCSTGNAFDCVEDLDDAAVSYVILRITGTRDQESKTVKFVFIVYVGPSVGGMQRGRVGGHKGDVKELVGQSHIDIQTDDKDELSEAAITAKLKKASGANYDLGSNAGGAYESKAGDIGKSAAARYKELEKVSNIGPVIFDTGPAKPKDYVTPVDLGGRPMVAPPTAAKKNIVLRDETTAAKTEKDAAVEKERLDALAARTKDGKNSAEPAVPAPQPAVAPVAAVAPPTPSAPPAPLAEPAPEATPEPQVPAAPEPPPPPPPPPPNEPMAEPTEPEPPSLAVPAAVEEPAAEVTVEPTLTETVPPVQTEEAAQPPPEPLPEEDVEEAAPAADPPPEPPLPPEPTPLVPDVTDAAPAPPARQPSSAEWSDAPQGEVLMSGVLSKAGSGLLANKYTPNRHVVVHHHEGTTFLSVYDSAEHKVMKGSRLRLEAGASVSVDGAVLHVLARDEKSSVAHETITQSYTSVAVNAKFKADSEEEASKWAEVMQRAIEGA